MGAGRPQKMTWPANIPLLRECKEWCDMCCNRQPEKRPTIQQMQRKIRRCMSTSPEEEETGGVRIHGAVMEARATMLARRQTRMASAAAAQPGVTDDPPPEHSGLFVDEELPAEVPNEPSVVYNSHSA